MAKYYLDASIWRDYYENRSDKFRPLGDWAFALLSKLIENGDFIIISDFVIEELEIKYSEQEIACIFGIIQRENLLIKIRINDSQAREAAKLCRERKVAFGDALHAVLARDNGAVMVTRDKHFEQLLDIADIRKPEELI